MILMKVKTTKEWRVETEMTNQKERENFIARMVTEFGDRAVKIGKGTVSTVDVARLLLRHSKTHGRLAEMRCECHPAMNNPNVPIAVAGKLQDERDAWIEKREGQIERRIKEVCDAIGLPVEFGGDPRGYTVKVFFPSGKYNTWGGAESGYGVPQ